MLSSSRDSFPNFHENFRLSQILTYVLFTTNTKCSLKPSSDVMLMLSGCCGLAVVGATCRAGLEQASAAPPRAPRLSLSALSPAAPPPVMSSVEQSGKHEVNTNPVHSGPNPGARAKLRKHFPTNRLFRIQPVSLP